MIKRYYPYVISTFIADLKEGDDGEWCKWKDVKELEKERDGFINEC